MSELKVTNPMTGEVLDTVTLAGAEEVQKMVDLAVAAEEGWAATPVYARAEYLYRFAGRP